MPGHYPDPGLHPLPLIKTMIGEFIGRNVVLVDPAKTAAHHLERILSERGLKADHLCRGQAQQPEINSSMIKISSSLQIPYICCLKK